MVDSLFICLLALRPISSPPTLYMRLSPGAWAEARIRLLPNLAVTPGVRLDLYHYGPNEPHDSWTVTPRVTARWDAREQLAFKAGFGFY